MAEPNSKAAFVEAVAGVVDVAVANRLAAAWEVLAIGDTDSDSELGRGLAVALSSLDYSAAVAIDNMALERVTITEEGVALSPVSAAAHPLIGRWAAPTLGEAMGQAIYAGRVGADLHPSTPIFQTFSLTEHQGRIVAADAVLAFNTQRGLREVRLRYGGDPNPLFGRVAIMSGDAPFRLGFALRGGNETLAAILGGALDDPPPPASPDVQPPAAGSFH